MQVGDLSRTHVPCERRDNPALQTMRLLLVGGLIAGGSLALGLTEEIPYLKKQQRLTFARVGVTDPLSLDDYLAHEGFAGLKAARDGQRAWAFVEAGRIPGHDAPWTLQGWFA